jgi:L-fucose mutarotase
MLKGIPQILSPELLKVLDEMGHGEKIVISDGNFPAYSVGKNAVIIRADGHGVPEILDAVLKLMPLDSYVEHPVTLMKTPIWDQYKEIVEKYDGRGSRTIGTIERFAFYREASEAYAVVVTGEKALYANVMLQKGIVTE